MLMRTPHHEESLQGRRPLSWNSEAGRVSGRIVNVHTTDFDFKGYTHHASPDGPQYEIKSDKTDHVAVHKGSALTKIGR